jgi:hypothetical protein
MTSRVVRFSGWSVLVTAGVAALACAAGLPAGALAQAPPAAVDQYKPAPPGNPDLPDDGRGDPNEGGPTGGSPSGAGGGGVPSGDTGGAPGTGSLAPGTGTGGEGGAASSGGGGADSDDSAATAATAGGRGEASAPVVAGYPLTPALIAVLGATLAALCAALGVAAWRRYRATTAVARPS